jgi:hypothetical protein
MGLIEYSQKLQAAYVTTHTIQEERENLSLFCYSESSSQYKTKLESISNFV